MKLANVRCIVRNDDKILLCFYKKGNHFFLPGGAIEHQELAEDAIYREFEEELGLTKDQVIIEGFKGIIENIYADRHRIELVFNVSIKNSNAISQEVDNVDFFWKSLSELDDIEIRPSSVKKMIRDESEKHVVSVDLDREII